MQIEIGEWLGQLQAGVSVLPPALIAAILLSGPTAAWLLYRFVVQPRAIRMASGDLSALWVCPSCRSVNELRMARCYRCDGRPTEADLELILSDPVGPRRLTAVGPGLDLGGPGRAMAGTPSRRPELSVTAEVAEIVERTEVSVLSEPMSLAEVAGARRPRLLTKRGPVPIGPGRPQVVRPRRAVVAGPAPDPDDTPAA